MSERHLVIVSYHFLPRVTPGSLRVGWMTRLLTGLGWRVTVVTSAGGTGTEAIRVVTTSPGGSDAGLWRAVPRAVRARARGLWKDVAIPDPHVTWAPVLVRALSRVLDEDPGIVLSSSPPHSSQIGVAVLRRQRRFPWVADYRDPWTAPTRYPRRAASLALHRWLERRALSAADAVVANTDGNRTALLSAFPELDAERVSVVTNGFEGGLDESAPDRDHADITYVGEIYPGMMDLYAEALEAIAARGGAVPTLAVYGEIDPREWRKLEAKGLARHVEARGFVPHGESLRAMRRAGSLLVLLPHRDSWRTCVPSKLYPYLAACRPVLALVPDGDASALVRRTGAGTAVTDSDPVRAGAAVERFVAGVRSGGELAPGREASLDAYACATLARRLDAILRRALESPRG